MCEKKVMQQNGNSKPGDTIGEVSVKLFAGLAESAGTKELRVAVKRYTVAGVRCALEARLPQAASPLSRSAVAVDGRYGAEDQVLHSKSEIAVIPPVSGG